MSSVQKRGATRWGRSTMEVMWRWKCIFQQLRWHSRKCRQLWCKRSINMTGKQWRTWPSHGTRRVMLERIGVAPMMSIYRTGGIPRRARNCRKKTLSGGTPPYECITIEISKRIIIEISKQKKQNQCRSYYSIGNTIILFFLPPSQSIVNQVMELLVSYNPSVWIRNV